MSHHYEGRPAHNEEDVSRACESLMEALQLEGTELTSKFHRPIGPEQGIDATARTIAGDGIDVQVVGVRQQDLLAQLGRTGSASSGATTDELADDVCNHVIDKRDLCPVEDRRHIILLIDAIRSPGHALPPVITMLATSTRSAILRTTGYQAIWLAGPTPSLTYRLDR